MVAVITVTIFFSCKNNIKEIQNIGVKSDQPLAIIEGGIGHYTDSGNLKSYIETSKMLDYSNREFAYLEFPEGMSMFIYDDDDNKSNIIADYAIVYNKTNLIDLRGNVNYITHKKDTLKTERLFYDQNLEWVYTNLPWQHFSPDGQRSQGNAFDSDKDFNDPIVFGGAGLFNIEE